MDQKTKSTNETKKNGNKKSSGGRYKYFNDYPFVDVKMKNGKIKRKRVYSADYYSYAVPKEFSATPVDFLNRVKTTFLLISLALFGLWLVSSFIRPLGHNCFYVVPAYVSCIVPLGMILFTVVEFVFTGNPLYERAFADSLTVGLRGKTIALMICSAITFVCQTIFIVITLINGEKSAALIGDYVFVVTSALTVVGARWFLKVQDSLKMEVVPQ